MMEFTGERYVPSLRGQIYYEHLHRYAVAARFCAEKRVLDIASGEGYGSALLARVAAEVFGVDIDERTVEHARAAYYASNLRFQRGSVTDVPLADRSVDVVVSFETIEHVDQHERMLDEFRRVLVPGGVVVISSPNKLLYSDIPNFSNPFHVKELYFSELRDLLIRRFRHVAIYGQRLAASSLIHPLAGAVCNAPAWFNGGAQHLAAGLPTLNNPMYFVAVCSDEPLAIVDVSSAYVDAGDDLLEDLWTELEALRAQARRALPDRSQPALTEANGGAIHRTARLPPALGPGSDDDLAAADRRVANLEAEIERLREQADAASDAVRAGYEVELAAQRGERADHDADLARLRAEYDAELASLRAERDGAVRACAAHADDVARLLGEREAAIAAAGQAAARLQRELDDTRIELQRTRGSVVVANAEANLERERVAGFMQQLAEARAAAAAEGRKVAVLVTSLQHERDRSEPAAAALRDEIRALAEAAERAEQDSLALRQVLASHSWKLTAPLRRVVRLIRR